ncbi:MAG: RteC domain-containing protein [Allomuricauda sp.]
MTKLIINKIDSYKREIEPIEKGNLNDFSTVEKGIRISRRYLQQFRLLIRENEFKSKNAEITFFKTQKPYIYSRLKFYAKLYQFLQEKPAGTIASQRKYIDSAINKLQEYNQKKLDFVKYYREGQTYLDKYYFVRGKDNISLATDNSHFYTDAEFSTSHDSMVAKIMAYDLLINHYQQELRKLRLLKKFENPNNKILNNFSKKELKWTASKTDLIELIYALQTSGAIENGLVAIKVMATACEELFEIELGNYYRTYLEIRERKKDRTKFLDKMKQTLITKMNNDED